MLNFTVDQAAALPPFAQLHEAIVDQITRGELRPGSKLPSVRALATQLGLAANTVARTYKQLEADGFVQTQGRNGTVVAPRLSDADQHRQALDLTRDYVGAMTAIGVDKSEIGGFLDRV